MGSRDEDIQKVRKAELRRGSRRRPLDEEALERYRKLKAAIDCVYNEGGTIDDLKAVMLAFGLTPNSPAWQETIRVWRDVTE
ncbi:MAG TPA: hypothetical protein VHA14_09145 [Bryobacteraceae bacterium]|nr:hypothetical protein [Bryobacteraceae bacterium]